MKTWFRIGKWVVLEMLRAVVRGYMLGKADIKNARIQREFNEGMTNEKSID